LPELFLTTLGAALPLLIALLGLSDPLSGAVATAAVLLWPGFALTQWIWPAPEQLSLAHRLALTPFLSLLINLLILLLAWFVFQSLTPVLIYSLVFGTTAIVALIAGILHKNLVSPISLHKETLGMIGIFFAFSGLFLLAAIAPKLNHDLSQPVVRSLNNQTPGGYTTFYLVGQKDASVNLSHELVRGEVSSIEVGIANQEGTPINYRVLVNIDNQVVGRSTLRVNNNTKWEGAISFTPQIAGVDQRVQLILERQGDANAYRILGLSINVKESTLP